MWRKSYTVRAIIITAFGAAAAAGADPVWWTSGTQPVINPAAAPNNPGPATVGQAKWMAYSALQALRAQLPDVAGLVEGDLLGAGGPLTTWDAPATGTPAAAAQSAAVTVGQLKALAAPFYTRLAAVAPHWLSAEETTNGTTVSGSIYPWAATTGPGNGAMATVGQLKAAFALRFERDADTDGLNDLWEDDYASQLLSLGLATTFWGSHYATLAAGDIDPAYDYLAEGQTAAALAATSAAAKGTLRYYINLNAVIRDSDGTSTYTDSSKTYLTSLRHGPEGAFTFTTDHSEAGLTEAFLKSATEGATGFSVANEPDRSDAGETDPSTLLLTGTLFDRTDDSGNTSIREIASMVKFRYGSPNYVVPFERKMFFVQESYDSAPGLPYIFDHFQSVQMTIPRWAHESNFYTDEPAIVSGQVQHFDEIHPMQVYFAYRDGHKVANSLNPPPLPDPPSGPPQNNFKYSQAMWFQPEEHIVAGVGKGDYVMWMLPPSIDWSGRTVSWRAKNLTSSSWPDIMGPSGPGIENMHWDFIDGDGLTDNNGDPWRAATYRIICTVGTTELTVDEIQVIPPH